MLGAFAKQPLVIAIPCLFLGLTVFPIGYGFWGDETVAGRTFLYTLILGSIGLAVFSLAVANRKFGTTRYLQLISIVSFFLFAPVLMAIPMAEVLDGVRFLDVYLDLVGVVTTTGLPVLEPDALSLTIQIWRGLIGWLSGFMMWVFAWSVFAPMNMGGFEHLGVRASQQIKSGYENAQAQLAPSERFWREFLRLFPIYIWITALAAVLMMIFGIPPLYALSRAVGAVATFGFIVDTNGPSHGIQMFSSECVLAVVFCFALSRSCFSRSMFRLYQYRLWQDPELRTAAVLLITTVIIILTTLIFRGSNIFSFPEFFQSIWALFFTALSFLTTTGYVAADWIGIQVDLGLGATGFILSGLAIFGGGVATTAGGVKLLRLYVLAHHSRGEIDGLISPSQVLKRSTKGLRQTASNAELAWVFVMVFALVFAAIILSFCLAGVDLTGAIQLTVASITNTGPLADTYNSADHLILNLPDSGKFTLVLAMVFGRLEVLAFLALLSPSAWK